MTPEQELYKFYYEDLKWCGCGNPEEVLQFMRDALSAINARFEEKPIATSEQVLLPLESPLALSYRYMLDALELTEHGGSVHGAWLTDKGKRIMELLQKANIEEFEGELPS